MKLNASRQFAAFLLLGWELISGAMRGPLLGKRAVGIVEPQRPDIVKSPHWKVVYGLNAERPDDDLHERVLSRRFEKMPLEDYPNHPGYFVIEKADARPRVMEYIDGFSDVRNDFPLYESRMEELAQRNERRMAGRDRKYYPYYK